MLGFFWLWSFGLRIERFWVLGVLGLGLKGVRVFRGFGLRVERLWDFRVVGVGLKGFRVLRFRVQDLGDRF